MTVIFKLPNKTAKLPEAEALPPEYSDEALALRFAKHHANDARYVAQWDLWLLWDGRRWVKDEKLEAVAYTRDVCRAAAAEWAICRSRQGSRVGALFSASKDWQGPIDTLPLPSANGMPSPGY